jgi:hypothetical protein
MERPMPPVQGCRRGFNEGRTSGTLGIATKLGVADETPIGVIAPCQPGLANHE